MRAALNHAPRYSLVENASMHYAAAVACCDNGNCERIRVCVRVYVDDAAHFDNRSALARDDPDRQSRIGVAIAKLFSEQIIRRPAIRKGDFSVLSSEKLPATGNWEFSFIFSHPPASGKIAGVTADAFLSRQVNPRSPPIFKQARTKGVRARARERER